MVMNPFKLIDSHIHLDLYDGQELEALLHDCSADRHIAGLIAVSMNLPSCRENARLARLWPGLVHPAFGYHPEQPLPNSQQLDELMAWIRSHADKTIAVGEVGLPYYSHREALEREEAFDKMPYIAMLESFIALADELDKPVVLHAVYEDAETACRLLANYPRVQAHFHWFKGPTAVVETMIERGYFISVTPDVLYEDEIRTLVRRYPLELTMVETDGPWPFEGPFNGMPTRPDMIRQSIAAIAELKGIAPEEAAARLFDNTVRFYRLNS